MLQPFPLKEISSRDLENDIIRGVYNGKGNVSSTLTCKKFIKQRGWFQDCNRIPKRWLQATRDCGNSRETQAWISQEYSNEREHISYRAKNGSWPQTSIPARAQQKLVLSEHTRDPRFRHGTVVTGHGTTIEHNSDNPVSQHWECNRDQKSVTITKRLGNSK
jgi:hypothetical protein